MATTGSPSHRFTQSQSINIDTNLQPPPGSGQQRRIGSPAASLSLPDGARQRPRSQSPQPRSPSPLRNGYIMDTSTGIIPNAFSHGDDDDDDDDDESDSGDQGLYHVADKAKWHRSPSPSSSVSHIAASFVQRVNNFVAAGIAPKSPMPTDAQLEAEAERERDRSRREAEAILSREAQQRELVEERVLAMMETAKSLPPPPSRSQTMPNVFGGSPSPSSSQKEKDGTNWWTAAKNRLTPTKDKDKDKDKDNQPLTPAQQVILDAKARETEKQKEKGKEKEWPANPNTKFSDPAFANLNMPVAPPVRKPVPPSPSSPTPSRPSLSNMPPNLTPSPMRSIDPNSSPSQREAPPLYVQFNTQGTLDVPSTLLAIAKRFEKLEKWTVGHVRALEERMNDVERWLVDKEQEKEKEIDNDKEKGKNADSTKPFGNKDIGISQDLKDIREEVGELEGRVGELGREMARMAAGAAASSPSRLSHTLVQDNTGSSIPGTPHHARLSSTTSIESTSPPMAPSKKTPSGTRLPYPQGDYTSPDSLSPTHSPQGSISTPMKIRPLSIPNNPISGLPASGSVSAGGLPSSYSSVASFSSSSSYGRTMSPPLMSAVSQRAASPSLSGNGNGHGLPAPKQTLTRQTNVSPTPRKRYTVALGAPISGTTRRPGTPVQKQNNDDNEDNENDESGFSEETIGKSAAARMTSSLNSSSFTGGKGMGDYKSTATSSPPSLSSNRRLRAQSAYGFSNVSGASTAGPSHAATLSSLSTPSVAPLRTRPKSTERLGSPSGARDETISSLSGGRFVDPLVLRKQSKGDNSASAKTIAMPMPKSMGKVPIGQLVAFFDGDKEKNTK